MFGLCTVFTESGVFTDVNFPNARTNQREHYFEEAAWFHFSYPGTSSYFIFITHKWNAQLLNSYTTSCSGLYGRPSFTGDLVFGMFGALMVSQFQSVSDYYTTARVIQIAPPPLHAINRGQLIAHSNTVCMQLSSIRFEFSSMCLAHFNRRSCGRVKLHNFHRFWRPFR